MAGARNARMGLVCAQPASPHSPSTPTTRPDAILVRKRLQGELFAQMAVSARVPLVRLVLRNARLVQEALRTNVLHVLLGWSF